MRQCDRRLKRGMLEADAGGVSSAADDHHQRDEGCRPAADLFDLPPLARVPKRPLTPTRAVLPQHGLQLARLVTRGLLLTAVGAVLRFPFWLTASFVAAAVVGELVAQWQKLSRLYWTALLSAVCAEATSPFISPFTWPMRSAFFFALIGAAVFFYGTQTNDLA